MPFTILPDKRDELRHRNISAQHDYPKGANNCHGSAVSDEHFGRPLGAASAANRR